MTPAICHIAKRAQQLGCYPLPPEWAGYKNIRYSIDPLFGFTGVKKFFNGPVLLPDKEPHNPFTKQATGLSHQGQILPTAEVAFKQASQSPSQGHEPSR